MSLMVKYVDAPLGAQESAVAAADFLQPFSMADRLVDDVADIPWATLEPKGWVLDGNRKLLSDRPGAIGWWSKELSDSDGRFSQPPVIAVTFPQCYTATGLTFRFWPSMNQWCSEISVSWYNGKRLLAQTTAHPDAAEWVLHYGVEGFDRVEISLLATNDIRQFAKLQHIQIGQVMVFLSDEIVQVRLLREVDPSLCRLSVDTMIVRIRDRKDRAILPQKDQAIHLWQNGQRVAAHYITDSQRDSKYNYTLRCQSAIGRLEDTFLGGMYAEYPLDVLLEEILGAFPFWLDRAFADETVTGYLPVCTRREALQQIAFAIGAVVTTQGDCTIRLLPLETEVTGGFEKNSIFAGGKDTRQAQIAAVQLSVHSYVQTEEQEVLLDNEDVHGEDTLFVFAEPHHSYGITGGRITAAGANWVRITANKPVVLTANKYRHTLSVRTKTNSLATAAERGNVVKVEQATLIHPGNADRVLDRLYDYHMLKHLLKQDVAVSGQYVGQLVESLNPWNAQIAGYICRMESEFTGTGQRANIQIRGREVVAV